jgi:hypothetical protein
VTCAIDLVDNTIEVEFGGRRRCSKVRTSAMMRHKRVKRKDLDDLAKHGVVDRRCKLVTIVNGRELFEW